MPVAIPGSTRNRRIQIGLQTDIETPAAATRWLPYSGVPSVDLGYEEDDSDVGSIDDLIPPYRTAIDATIPMSGRARFNDLPYWYSGAFKGGVTPTGATAKVWTYQLASLTQDDFDFFTIEQGDDLDGTGGKPNDWYQLVGCTAESFEMNGPDNLGPFEISGTWRASDVKAAFSTDSPVVGTVPTTGLTSNSTDVRAFLADTQLFIDDAYTGIGGTQITDAIYSVSFSFSPELDWKRFANGSNTRFAASGVSRGPRVIEVTIVAAKTADITGVGSESDHWLSDEPVNRYVEIRTTSTEIITGSTPYSNSLRMPLRYRTREGTDRNNNTTVTLVGRAFYDDDLEYALRASVTNTLAEL